MSMDISSPLEVFQKGDRPLYLINFLKMFVPGFYGLKMESVLLVTVFCNSTRSDLRDQDC